MEEFSITEKASEKELLPSLTQDSVTTHEVSEEFSLPDYVPEIRRLLCTRAQVLPESKYVNDSGARDALEWSGTLTYLLIYTNDEGELCSLPLSSAYEASCPLNDTPNQVFIDTYVDSVNARVVAPRKISLKSRLKSKIAVWSSVDTEEQMNNKSSADELFIERQTVTIPTISQKQISQGDIRVSDKLDMQGLQNPTPLWCDAFITVSDVKPQSGTVSVRGSIRIKCLCQNDGDFVTLSKTVPLAEEIPADGAMAGDKARVSPRCVSLTISNEQNDDSGQLFFDLTCELEGEVTRNVDYRLTSDCYSTKYETDEEYRTIDIYSSTRAQGVPFSINESVKRKSKDIDEIIDVICDPVYEKTEFKGGRAIIFGKLSLTVIGKHLTENEPEYVSEGYELPFKYAVDMGRGDGDYIARCSISADEVNVRFDGDKLNVSAQIYPALEIIERAKQKILSVSTQKKDKEIKKDASCVRIYFPKEGDTLWEIAKKYHTTVSRLKEQNDLSAENVEAIKSLII